MWDLDTIIAQNNQAAIEAMMRPPAVEAAQTPRPEAWPLSTLAKKLKVGPPLLSELLKCFTNIDDIEKFVAIIREFLPEHEADILTEPRFGRLYKFCYLFSKRYFPLPIFMQEAELGGFVASLPVEMMGMSYSSYHDLGMRLGYALLLALVVYPYEGDWRDEEDDRVPFDPTDLPAAKFKPSASDIAWVENMVSSLAIGGQWLAPMGFAMVKVAENKILLRDAKDTPDVKETIRRTLLIAKKAGIEAEFSKTGRTAQEKLNGAKVPLFDMIQGVVGEQLVKMIPPAGWEPDTLHKMTDGTPYDGLGDFADWVCSNTGCVVLDSNYGDCEYIEGYGEPLFKWSRYNVDRLTESYPKAQELRGKIARVVDWLERDPQVRYRELLDFLLSLPEEERKPADPARWRTVYDPTEHWCPLEPELGREEDEEDAGDEA
ncbi:MAG TPA: hypothetical protein VMW86_06340 [Dehalococcoidales bacterium]|nr:hypothetical protein [Dehalococcoidales bacterium]